MKNQNYIKLFAFSALLFVTTTLVCSENNNKNLSGNSNQNLIEFLNEDIAQNEKNLESETVKKFAEGYDFLGFFYIINSHMIDGFFLFDKKIKTVILEFCDLGNNSFSSLSDLKKYCLLIRDKIKVESFMRGHKMINFDEEDDFAGVTIHNVFIPVIAAKKCNLGKLKTETEVEEKRKELQETIIQSLQDK